MYIDKIILVGDFENLRKIYYHRYGAGVDFTGYISKFYTEGIFAFNLKTKARGYIAQVISTHINNSPPPSYSEILSGILFTMFDAGVLDLRSLDKLKTNREHETVMHKITPAKVTVTVMPKSYFYFVFIMYC